MAHKSDHSVALNIHHRAAGALEIAGAERAASVWLVATRLAEPDRNRQSVPGWHNHVAQLASRLHEESMLAVLTSPEQAALLWPKLDGTLRFQLWIALKLKAPIPVPGQLAQHHAALLVASKYRACLRHTKTRIAYTYCPACDKTTKDYGGKKHLYDAYGTLISDVWRDISHDPAGPLDDIASRLGDLFGLTPYRDLNVVDLRSAEVSRNAKPSRPKPTRQSAPAARSLDLGLHNGDCREVLARIPDNSVDFCFADPPYNLQKKYDRWDDGLDITEYFNWCDGWIGELARILKPGRTCAILNIPQWCIRHFTYMRTILRFQSWIAWEGLSLPVRMIMPAHYGIVCFSKGVSRDLPGIVTPGANPLEQAGLSALNEFFCMRANCFQFRRRARRDDSGVPTDLWWDIHRLKHNSRRVDHPCQLPPALMRRLLALFTTEDEMILDPFNGAGTTTLCAEQLGRRYIGIELSKAYHDIAASRHQDLQRGVDPFAKQDAVPTSKNSRVKRLEKQVYAVSKKKLQLEVRRIARSMGRMPTRDEMARLGNYDVVYYDRYFINWGEVCAAARATGMSEDRQHGAKGDSARQLTLFARS